MDRCELCGSWDSRCSSDEPVRGCGCVRCASFRIIELERLLRDVHAEYKREANLFTTIKRIEAALNAS